MRQQRATITAVIPSLFAVGLRAPRGVKSGRQIRHLRVAESVSWLTGLRNLPRTALAGAPVFCRPRFLMHPRFMIGRK